MKASLRNKNWQQGSTVAESLKLFAADFLCRQLEDNSPKGPRIFQDYMYDPVRFGETVLGDSYTDDMREMFDSVVWNEVTFAQSGNALGKSLGASRVALWWYLTRPNAEVYMAAAPPESNLRNILWDRLSTVIAAKKHLFVEDSISLPGMRISRPGSLITGVTIPAQGTPKEREARFAGKHAPYLLFICDEADAIPAEVFDGIESCMSGGEARLLLLFNPRDENSHVAGMQKAGRGNTVHLSALRHPNVVEGRDVIPGAVTRERTIKRVHAWTRPLLPNEMPGMETWEVPDVLAGIPVMGDMGKELPPLAEGEFRKVVDQAFWYMVLGQYPAQGEDQLIATTWVDQAISRYLEYTSRMGVYSNPIIQSTQPIAGLDVAELGPDLNSLCVRYGSYVIPLDIWRGVDIEVTSERAAEKCRLYVASEVFVDSTGVGAGVWPKLRKEGILAHRIMVVSNPEKGAAEMPFPDFGNGNGRSGDLDKPQFQTVADEGWWNLREWLRTDPTAMLPNDPLLREELIYPKYTKSRGKIVVCGEDQVELRKGFMRKLRRSADRASSLMLTFCRRPAAISSKLGTHSYIGRNNGNGRNGSRKLAIRS